jgi:anti-anti-sigma factor
MRLHINTLFGNTTAVVRCAGDIIYKHEADQFREKVARLLQPIVLLDLEHVRRVDAYGLGSLASLVELGRERGADLIVVNPRPRVRELLRLTKLDGCISPMTLGVAWEESDRHFACAAND